MTAPSPEVVAGVLRIPIQDLVHGGNARGRDLGDVSELANSLRRFGQQQPLIVEPREDGGWSVFDGNRRLLAARQVNLTHLLAIPRNKPLNDTERVLRQLSMHSTAVKFDPIAESEAIEWLMFGDAGPKMTREEIARALSKSGAWVKGRIDLRQLDPDEQASVRRGTISVTAGLMIVAGRRGRQSESAPPVNTRPWCDQGTRCGCVCHKRNQAT